MHHQMEINGLSATFHMPPALKKKIVNGKEVAQGLPPCKSVQPYKVDEYPACPTDWMNGSSKASSYFVGVKESRGMWLDFNSCRNHTHHIAVVISVQGINPITGLKQSKMALEQYGEKCPKHDVEFEQDRFCPKCKYKWPAQNYLSSAATPSSLFWLDGFRNEEGQVAQYILTEDVLKGVASQILKKERVFAIGIAFFLSKEPKPQPVPSGITRGYEYNSQKFTMGGSVALSDYESDFAESQTKGLIGSSGPAWVDSPFGATMGGEMKGGAWNSAPGGGLPQKMLKARPMTASLSASTKPKMRTRGSGSSATKGVSSYEDVLESFPEVITEKQMSMAPVREVKLSKNLEIGHGAAINQQVYPDMNPLSFYQDEPAGLIYINYATEEDVQKILEAGKREEAEGGFLAGLTSAAE